MPIFRAGQPIRLLIPAVIAFMFIIDGCKKEYSSEFAEGSLHNSLDQCFEIRVSGTYSRDQLPDKNHCYIEVLVQVTKPGSFRLETDSQNGFSFSASGNFESSGLQKVKLGVEGRPLRDSVTSFTCRFNGSSCRFAIPVGMQNAVGTQPAGDSSMNTWEFYDSTRFSYHHGVLEQTGTAFVITPQWNRLNLLGWPGAAGATSRDTMFFISIYLPHPYIQTGTFTISSGVGGFNLFRYADYSTSSSNLYYFEGMEDNVYPFIFRIIGWDPDKKILNGTFAGTARRRVNQADNPGENHIVSGRFRVQLP